MEFDKDRGSQVAKFSTRDIPRGIIFYRGYPCGLYFFTGEEASGVLSRDVINPAHPASYPFLCTRNIDMSNSFQRELILLRNGYNNLQMRLLLYALSVFFRAEIFMRKRDRKLSLPKFVVSCGLY